MEITKKMLEYIAMLAKVKIPEDYEEKFAQDLENLIDYVEIMNEVDTTGIEPMSHNFSNTNSFREDICTGSSDIAEILANTPATKNNCFKVPKTVD